MDDVFLRTATTRRLLALVVVTLIAVSPAAAQPGGADTRRDAALLAALRKGGFILYFRHADTDHTQRDADAGNFDDCASQRNLSDRGREHARAIGETIRALGIPIGPADRQEHGDRGSRVSVLQPRRRAIPRRGPSGSGPA